MLSLRSMSLAVATIALLAPYSAHAEIPAGWYLGGNTIMSFERDSDIKVSGSTDQIEYKTGWGLAGYGGYAFGNGFRTEAELAYRHSEADSATGLTAGPVGGGIHNWALMANALYDFDTNTRITPYVGAGIGAALVDADNLRTINSATLDEDRVAFAYQGIVGASVALDGGWAFTADYRYFATPDVKFKTNVGVRGETENASHNLMLGIRYTFAEPKAVAPEPVLAPPPAPVAVPAPRQAPAPVVAPVPQSYLVFFDFDRSTITPEAARIIAAAAADYKQGTYVRLIVTGHTDTMGTVKYNQRLSERRAAAVKAEFERLGVPLASIATKGAGEGSLMVPTADQVREAQNRRAEIVLQK
ncbi:MAG: OmpA family protein [Bdellovibrionales bacterium]